MIRSNFHHRHNFFRHHQFTSSAPTFFVRFCSSSSTNNFNINDGNQHDEFLEPDFSIMQSIPRADAFAKPRLVNFLNRFHQPLGTYSTTPVEGGGTWYRCETRIPIFLPSSLPSSPERVATAVGFGKTEKEAENACAMHAERILDAAGAELFSLGAMQARHAEAAIKEGRWARFPKNHPKRVQQDEETISQGKSHSTLPPPLISMVTAEGKIHVPIQTKNDVSSSSSMNKTTIVEEFPNQQGQEEEKSANATTTSRHQQHHLSTYYSRSLFSNDKTKVDSPGDIIEITIDDTKFTDDSEAQHEGIEIDQAEHCDWRIFPRVSQNKAVPPAFKHMDESEGGAYWLVEFGMYYQCESHSLLSPHLFCADSLERVRQYFSRHDAAKREFDDCVLQTKLGYTPWAGQRTTLIKVSVEIPGLEDPYQIVQAVGVSKDFDRALHLCAMHAELMIDHLGLILFPDEPELQEKHADFCASMGRWAASEEGEVVSPGKANPRPKPLREWGESVAVHAPKNSEENFASAGRKVGRGSLQARRVAPLSEEEFYMHCHHCMIAPNRGHTIEGNPFGENNSNNSSNYNEIAWDYVEILRDFNKQLDMQRESFYLNLDYSGVYRCTTLLPLDIKTYGLRCGYAIGNTPQEAKILCAWHAIEVLTHFGVPVFPKDPVKQKQFEDQRRRQGRFVVDRDKKNENEPLNAPSAKSRSPPSLRIAGPSRPLIRYDDWRAAQMIDASVFTVVDVSESKFDRDLIITAFENYCRNVFDSEHEEKLWEISTAYNKNNNTNEQKQQIQQCIFPSPSTAKMPSGIPHISFYWGLQPVLGRFAVQANTAFAAVPLPRGHPARDALGGAASFLAVGRATDQKNAVKCFYLHAVRCLDSLGLLEDYCLKLNQYGDGNASFGEGSFASPPPAMHQKIEKEVETVTQQPEPKSPTKKAKGPKIIVLQAKTAILSANNNNNSNTAEPVEKIQPEATKPLLNAATIPKSKVKAQPILDIEKLRKALSSVTAVVVQDHRDPSKFFSWGTPEGSKCSALRLFDDNGRPVNAAVINEQKRMQNIIVQQLPVPVMNTVVANICNERRTSKRWRMENQQRENEQAGGAQKSNVNPVF